MVTRGLISATSPFRIEESSVRIESEHMLDSRVSYPKPSRMSLPSSRGFYPKGYSDHFPVSCVVTELGNDPPALAVPTSAHTASRAPSPAPTPTTLIKRAVAPQKS